VCFLIKKLREFRGTPEVDNPEPSFDFKRSMKVQRLGIDTDVKYQNIMYPRARSTEM